MADELGPAPDSASLTPRRNLSLREQIFEVFEEPGSSWLAIVVSFILNMMILFSTVTFIIETHPYFRNVHADASTRTYSCGRPLEYSMRLPVLYYNRRC